MAIFDQIVKPTLLLDSGRAVRNIQRMCIKAKDQGVRFRPHFKTHQSAEIGEWFRREGVTAITVSSVDMAEYFADNGWQDITIAFPVNIRQIETIRELSGRVHLELLVEGAESAAYLEEHLSGRVEVWMKIDSGLGRTGLAWNAIEPIASLARQIDQSTKLHLRGILTHAGHTYQAKTPDEVRRLFAESVQRMGQVRDGLKEAGAGLVEVSVGDTPGCSLSESFGDADEVRPGNFVFYDAEQFSIGACTAGDIAVALACPVVARHPERNEAVIYGGAVHLSKDWMPGEGPVRHGLVALPAALQGGSGDGWGNPLAGAYVDRLSQEHGVVHLESEDLDRLRIGDLVCVLPVHSCLTVQVMGEYMTLKGRRVGVMNR
jgi:D-serine deaminase-like pyridoxal phosphate-dependent protein